MTHPKSEAEQFNATRRDFDERMKDPVQRAKAEATSAANKEKDCTFPKCTATGGCSGPCASRFVTPATSAPVATNLQPCDCMGQCPTCRAEPSASPAAPESQCAPSIAPQMESGRSLPGADKFIDLMRAWRFANVGGEANRAFKAVVDFVDVYLAAHVARNPQLPAERVRVTMSESSPLAQAHRAAVASKPHAAPSAARVVGITPGMGRIELDLDGDIPAWADLGCTVYFAAPSSQAAPDATREILEHAARICESRCVCDNGEADEDINWVLQNRAAQIRGLVARASQAAPSELTDEPTPAEMRKYMNRLKLRVAELEDTLIVTEQSNEQMRAILAAQAQKGQP